MPPEEVFTRATFGLILIATPFVPGGIWIAFVLGALFLLSAKQGICLTCIVYRKFFRPDTQNIDKKSV